MKSSLIQALMLLVVAGPGLPRVAQAQFLDQDGVTLLWATTTNLNGSGIRVAHAEDPEDAQQAGAWEVDPAQAGQAASRFTYTGSGGTTKVFPNALGTNSYHAVYVGQKFYGSPYGIATNVARVDNFESPFFYNRYIANQVALNDPVVNQSYTFGALFVADQQQVDRRFDDYAARFKTLFVSAVDNGGGVHAPSTCYNGIGVGAYNGLSSIGPTADNGRCKPDICAPDYVTSFATPQVSGAAVLLLQAALRGDGGKVKQLAADPRTLKALLLNGAIKPPDWTNSSSAPLDARYGAGRVNVYNSYQQLIGGKRNYSVSSRVASGGAHPPMAGNKTVSVLSGWDYNNVTSSRSLAARDGVNHYYFNATNTPTGVTCQATLVWNRHFGKTNINNLDLFLYDCANSNLVACSTSLVDNVEHIFAPNLPPGRYDLQVLKAGGTSIVSPAEPYTMAFAFTSPTLTVNNAGRNPSLSGQAYLANLK